jgi:putative flippase GtrA
VSTSAFQRVLKFALVGGIGVGVQLGVLAALSSLKINYLLATALAVEAAVIHNFLWHQRFTWADRAGTGMRGSLTALLRFHLTNGLISIVGNLLLMRFFVPGLGLPLLHANLATIAVCFLANFLASDRWVFSSS